MTERIRCCMILAFALLLASCSSDIALKRVNLGEIGPMQAVRRASPPIETRTLTGALLVSLGGFATVPAGYAHEASVAGKVRKGVVLPDFSELVMKDFLEQVRKEVPDWPKVAVLRDPVDKEYAYDRGPLLTFQTGFVRLSSLAGLWTVSGVTLTDPSGNILWKKSFKYTTFDNNRKNQKSFDEYVQDEGRLFAAELEHAAAYVADVYVRHLREIR